VRLRQRLHTNLARFLENPASVRNAAWLMISATVAAVVIGALVMWLLDREEYPNLFRALWFTLQTVTTVGYGDVTPESVVGRVVGAVVMLTAIAFITIITAAITSTFVEAARRKGDTATETASTAAADDTRDQLARITAQLDQMERTLEELAAQARRD
jgi:voltage-gated potassium channel